MARSLLLSSPYLSGDDVAAAQRALGVPADGLYGPVTASAAAAWKRAVGYPERAVMNSLSPLDQRRLLGSVAMPPAFEERARVRAREEAAVPQRAVEVMERWAGLDYAEDPPGSNVVPQLVAIARGLGVAPALREMGYPWCALAAFLAALEVGGRTADAALRRATFNALYCPTVLAEAQAGRWGLRVIAASQAARGDLVLFDWGPGGDPTDHLGRLLRPPTNGRVATVDGNSGPDYQRVALRERPLGLVRAFVRDA